MRRDEQNVMRGTLRERSEEAEEEEEEDEQEAGEEEIDVNEQLVMMRGRN